MRKEDILFTIREWYSRTGENVPLSVIYKTYNSSKNQSTNKFIRSVLIELEESKKINFLRMIQKIEPIFTEGEISYIQQKESKLDEIKIKECIRSLFKKSSSYPTPNEIANEFIKNYGHVNIETITRYVRKLFEDGKLLRDLDNKYYFKGIESSNIGLRGFT